MKLTSRPATATDVQRWYPDARNSFKAWVAEIDGEARGIIGLALTRPAYCLFSAFDEELRPHLRSLTVLRLIKKVEALIQSGGVPVRAIAEPTEPTAPAILERLGFEHVGRFGDDEIYEWGGH